MNFGYKIRPHGESGVLSLDFWNNKKVFLTGHTGFKGAWTTLWLQRLGANVMGYSLAPNTSPNFFSTIQDRLKINSIIGDIRDYDFLKKTITQYMPDIIIHMAAQPLVRLSYDDPVDTYSTNIMGTVNILDIAKDIDTLKTLLNVTSDKCYKNKESKKGYTEEDELGGFDPYSNSKSCAELISYSYFNSFFVNKGKDLVTCRAGNVIGGGDWSEDRIVPDFVKAFIKKQELFLRNPDAIRPWQHVIEPIYGYLTLIEKTASSPLKFSGPWNFGPDADESFAKVIDLINEFKKIWPGSKYMLNNSINNLKKETKILKLVTKKTRDQLKIRSLWNLTETAKRTLDWYSEFYNNQSNIFDYSLQQLQDYEYEINN
jgi:CDP-glucose 4,6-dehydratase